MQQIHDLRRIDLNLLVVLDALLSERHVSRAAQRLAMSQPAVSHALGRLRELFGDPLLVRVKSRMQLTSLALELAPKLQASLDQVRGVIGGPTFEPVRSRRHFRLGMSDYGAWVVLPALLRQQQALAPGVSFGIVQEPRLETARQVAEGQLDCALGVFPCFRRACAPGACSRSVSSASVGAACSTAPTACPSTATWRPATCASRYRTTRPRKSTAPWKNAACAGRWR